MVAGSRRRVASDLDNLFPNPNPDARLFPAYHDVINPCTEVCPLHSTCHMYLRYQERWLYHYDNLIQMATPM